ncbi:MAG: hypothetical protein JSR86_21580 [Proteobacteria bacterium]|nr:hypothetical protein [Pseudomonadota bacterium]
MKTVSHNPGHGLLQDRLDALTTVSAELAGWVARQPDGGVRAWPDAEPDERAAFGAQARRVIAALPDADQRLWASVTRRAAMRGLSPAEAEDRLLALLWAAAGDHLDLNAGP